MPDYLSLLAENAQRDLEAYKATAETIVKVIADGAKAAADLTAALSASGTQKDLSGNYTKAQVAQTELTLAVKEYAKIQTQIATGEARLAALTSESARSAAANAAAVRESTKALRDEANANNASFQQRQQDNQAKRDATAAGRALEAQNKKEQKALADLNNEYKLLGVQLAEETRKYQQLFLTAGEFNAVTLEQKNRVMELDAVLKKIDANTGNYRRNVGNYASAYNGLGNSIQQILREAPSAAVSLNTFFLAISNNLPIFFDEITKINTAQKEANKILQEQLVVVRENATAQALNAGATAAAAEAEAALAVAAAEANAAQKSAPGILKQLGTSLFSVNTLLTLGVLALTLYGGKLFDASAATSELQKRSDDLTKALNNVYNATRTTYQEQARQIKVITSIIADRNLPLEQRKKAIDELRNQNPSYLKGYTDEQILAGKAAGAINALNEAIKNKEASAAASKAAQLYQDQLTGENGLIKQQEAALKRLQNAQINLKKLAGTGEAEDQAGEYLVAAQRDYNLLTQAVNALKKAQEGATNSAVTYAKASGNSFFSDKTNADPKAAKTPRDTTGVELRAQTEFTKALYDELSKRAAIEAEIAKGVAENEELTLEERLRAYDTYSQKRIEEAGFTTSGEYDIIQESLDKIVDIEQKSANKRTNAESDLLLRKDALIQQQTNLVAQYELDVTKVVNDNAKNRADETEKGLDAVAAAAKRMTKDLSYLNGNDNKKPKRENGGILGFTDQDRKDFENVESYTSTAINAFQALSNVLDQISAKRRQQNEDEINAIDKKTQREIDGLSARELNASDLAKKEEEIRARGEAQKAALEQKQKQRDIADARRNKALTVAKIIAETALAVVHQLGSGDPYTAYARAIAAGAIGAAQIAVALATPIPSYGEGAGVDGKPAHKGGKMLVGEKRKGSGFEKELIIENGKAPYWVDQPQVLSAAAGTRVIPESKIDQLMYAGLSANMIASVHNKQSAIKLNGVEDRLDKWGRKQVEAIMNSRTVIRKSPFDSGLINYARK